MKVFIDNAKWSEQRLIKKVAVYVADYLKQPHNLEVNVTIVSPEEIQQLNSTQRNVDAVTDVLSFPTIDAGRQVIDVDKYPADINPSTGNLMLGDIVICRKRAEEQATEYGHSVKRELAFLTLHGVLHLLGYDHIEEQDEQQMRQLQSVILTNLKITRDK